MAIMAAFLSLILMFSVASIGNSLSLNYYEKTCPHAEFIVAKTVKDAISKDKTVPAALLRMHFHDCFIRGCDASVLLNSKGNNKAEKDGPPNVSLHAFHVIDNAKKAVEASCPGVVSCADIVAFAARDSVYLKEEKMEENQRPVKPYNCQHQPSTYHNYNRASPKEVCPWKTWWLLGFSHCSSFRNRIHNFNAAHGIDPTLNPSFAAKLKSICPLKNQRKNAGTTMDPSAATFDNTYYKLIIQGKSLFSSDQALLNNPKTKNLVYEFATSREAFYEAFAKSMIKMGSINGGQEVRKDSSIIF